MRRPFYLIGLLCYFLLSACASISTMHTAETTEKGSFDHTLGFGSLNADVDTASGVSVDDQTQDTVSVPMAEYMLRYGVSDSVDVGLRTSGFVHGADLKWNFLKGDRFLMAIGAGANYLTYTLGTGTNETKVTSIDIVPAVFLDYKLTGLTRLYAVPKVVNRRLTVTGGNDENINYMGGSIGFKWGQSSGVFVEYTMLSGSYTPTNTSTEQDVALNQFSAGFFF